MVDRKSILSAIVVSGLALCAVAGPASAASPADPRGTSGATEPPPEALAALERDLGLSAEQAKQQQAQQAKAIKLDRALQRSLGTAFAGSAYDARTGKLVVSVSDPARIDDVKAAGAEARLAKHSKAELGATMADLDAAAGKGSASSPADRRASGARTAGVAGLTSWHVDTTANVVRVTVAKGKSARARAALAKYGDRVAIEESAIAPTTTANWMDGGDHIRVSAGNCSAGFNLRSSNGAGYLLTAGHCANPSSTLTGQDWNVFGLVLESWYRSGYDDALVRNDNAGHWIQGPWVDTQRTTNDIFTVRTWTDAPVGTSVCKAGITTKWTCGYITAKNETVNMSGVTVYGLTRHSACTEPGDSGGSNVSTATWAAEGVTSGAQLISNRCKSAYGQANVSWYHPISDSLNYYGPRYGVTMWPG